MKMSNNHDRFLKKILTISQLIILLFSCRKINDPDVKTPPIPSIYINGSKVNLYHSNNFIRWSEKKVIITVGNGADSDSDGILNTKSIVSQLGSGDYAAYYCDTLTEHGFSDWYLPSYNELQVIYNKMDSINFEWYSNYYWSSTESHFGNAHADIDSVYAESISMMNGKTLYNMKVEGYNVVCIRKD